MKDFKGYIALYRKLLDSPIFKNQNTLQVAIYCLLKATHKEHSQTVGDQVVKLKAGQLVTGRKRMAQDCNLSEQSVRTTMRNLEKLDFLTIKSTNKFSVVTVLNWESYQLTNQQTTSSLTTNNNTNNKNNIKVPEGINLEAWDEWLEYRSKKKKKVSEAAAKKQFKLLLKYNQDDQQAIINQSIASDYQGLFELKGKSNETSTGHQSGSAAARTAENIQKEFG